MSTTPAGPPSHPAPFPRRTIDVSHMPEETFGERSPVWWGNMLMLFIESSTVAILVVSYLYLRMNFQQWPPPKVDVYPPIQHPVPDLGVATLNVALIVLSIPVMIWTHRAALRMDKRKVLAGVAAMFAAGVLVSVLRCAEFRATKFWWNDNAYASIVWTIIGMHLLYSLAGALEFLVMGLWILSHDLDEAHALDVTLAGIYWYWVAGTGVIVYALVYWGGRLL
jgi:heme/copper-type cytochrome/quinol oxidase subunit 3